ncbi:hypothetical protein EJ110_NYTH08868 [Nymphaea thermarum]|nr:hypothetical protein EJ110_NYTH08868 [Nymphaea thermarum]
MAREKYETSSVQSQTKGIKMNSRLKTSLQNMKTPPKCSKDKMDVGCSRVTQESSVKRSSTRDRKLALQQDVDKLKKKLRHEENVHRALERAFTRPLGALPRLPPYLPQYTLELLAEVAVLEEEVVRLEAQVVNFRQGLYQEAVYISSTSSSKKPTEIGAMDSMDRSPTPSKQVKLEQSSSEGSPNVSSSKTIKNSLFRQSSVESESNQSGFPSNRLMTGKHTLNKGSCSDGKENQLQTNPSRNRQSPQKASRPRMLIKQASEQKTAKNQELATKIQPGVVRREKSGECIANVHTALEEDVIEPSTLSEDILKCLLSIFMKLASVSRRRDSESLPIASTVSACGSPNNNTDTNLLGTSEHLDARDPYGICAEFGEQDVGQYKYVNEISASSIQRNRVPDADSLMCRLKQLLVKLESVDLRGLTHQQKLAFWINIYNSCMMNAFLEHGIPDSPHTVVALMRKAILNVGGHMLNALTIEHFILRLPYHSKHTLTKGGKNDEGTMRSIFGLDWPEPLVTFALSCGSWSSPAVRVYTANKVEDELEVAKREYLQAAVGISSKNNKLVIPKLLDWYLLDFAKDVDSLLDWICLQLPSVSRKEAVKCLERGRKESLSHAVQIMPYEFSFRYLLAT